MGMEHISIGEFLNLTKLSDSDVIAMLENGELTVTTGPMGEVLIDISEVTPELIARRTKRSPQLLRPEDRILLEEIVASEILSSLSTVVDESLELAIKWYQDRAKDKRDTTKKAP